jgi:hypothetical protein
VQEGQQLLVDRVSADTTRHAEHDDLDEVHHPAADPKLHKYPAIGVTLRPRLGHAP